MKLGLPEIISGIEQVASDKITSSLKEQGFDVYKNYKALKSKKEHFDIYAEKGDDKRIYELKIGKNRIQNKQFVILQDEAKRLGAKLFIVYLEIPKTHMIEFLGIENIIYQDLVDDFPSELDALSTHTTIDSVNNVEIEKISIEGSIAKITGSGTINVDLQFGSRSDLNNGEAIEDSNSIDFFFKISIDVSTNIIVKRYYKIDVE